MATRLPSGSVRAVISSRAPSRALEQESCVVDMSRTQRGGAETSSRDDRCHEAAGRGSAGTGFDGYIDYIVDSLPRTRPRRSQKPLSPLVGYIVNTPMGTGEKGRSRAGPLTDRTGCRSRYRLPRAPRSALRGWPRRLSTAWYRARKSDIASRTVGCRGTTPIRRLARHSETRDIGLLACIELAVGPGNDRTTLQVTPLSRGFVCVGWW